MALHLWRMIGRHAVKHTSNLHGGTELNVFECEYNGSTRGAAHRLGFRSYMGDMGFERSLEILSDSPAGANIRVPAWFGTPKTRASTISMASGTSGSRTSLNIIDQNHAQHCGHFLQRQQAEEHWNGTREHLESTHTVVRRSSHLKLLSPVIQCLHVHSLRIKYSSSLATNPPSHKWYHINEIRSGSDVSYWMWSRKER